MTEFDTFDRDLAAALRDYAGRCRRPSILAGGRGGDGCVGRGRAVVGPGTGESATRRDALVFSSERVLVTLTLAASALWVGRPIPIPAAAAAGPGRAGRPGTGL